MPNRKRLMLALVALFLVSAIAGTGRAAAQAAATVQIHDVGSFGAILTGTDGKTLYMFDRDTAGVSNCNDQCAGTWPALTLASGDPAAPAGLSGKLALITRTDSKRQVTYNDRPLYFFAADAQAGDTKGDGVGGIWHVAKAVAATTTAASAAAPASQAAAAPAAANAPAAASASGLPRAGNGGQAGGAGNGSRIALLALVAGVMAAAGLALRRFSAAGERGR